MLQTEYTENLFRSIDTIIAERIKNLPYDTTQLAEITDTTNCKQGMYKISADNQFEEIAYSDNPTYEVGDKVYVLTTSDKTRRFIIGIFQRCSSGRTDRILSTLNQKIELLDSSLTDKYLELKDETSQFMAQLSITAKELRSEYLDLSQGLNTLISQTAEEILLKAENSIEQKYASLSITADGISTRVGDAINELETRINQTASEIRLEAEDMKNGLEASLSITAEQIRSEVSNELLGVESSISQTASEIRSEVADHLLGIESSISQTANEIRSEIHDETGAQESSIDQKLDEIRLRVTDTQLGMSEISQQADSINSKVEDIEGNFSQIKQETDKITSKVYDIEGNFSQIQQMADSITSRVESIEGNYSEIKQTANSIRSRVEDINGYASTIEQKADSIQTEVRGKVGATEVSTQIKQFADNLSLTATNGSTSSTLKLKSGTTELSSANINFSGLVTFSNLKDGTTTISGNNIKTGTIDAKTVGLKWLGTDKGGGFTVANGSTGGITTFGAMMYGWQTGIDNIITALQADSTPDNAVFPNNYIIATSGGVRMTHKGFDFYIADNGAHVVGATLYTPDGTVSTSDKNLKNSINYDFQKYENFYNLLQPAYYKFNSGTSNRFHIGFIYQDVETALLRSGITSQDFAGLVKNHGEKGEVKCGLRYEEFIALNTHMIQKTRKDLEEKDNKIQQLENKIDELEQKLNLLLETLS